MEEERGFNPAPADDDEGDSRTAAPDDERAAQGEDPTSPERGFDDIEDAAGEEDDE